MRLLTFLQLLLLGGGWRATSLSSPPAQQRSAVRASPWMVTEEDEVRRVVAREMRELSPRSHRIRRLADRIRVATDDDADLWASSVLEDRVQAKLGSRTYAALLMAFRRRRAWKSSVALLSHALAHEPDKLNAHHFSMAISGCGAHWRPPTIRGTPPGLSSALPRADPARPRLAPAGAARQSKAALRLLEMMAGASVPADLVCFNAALSACAATGDHASALRLLQEAIPAAGLQPDAYSYSAAFSALGRCATARLPLSATHGPSLPRPPTRVWIWHPPRYAPACATRSARATRRRRPRCSRRWRTRTSHPTGSWPPPR